MPAKRKRTADRKRDKCDRQPRYSGAEQINKPATLNDDARPSMSDENRARDTLPDGLNELPTTMSRHRDRR